MKITRRKREKKPVSEFDFGDTFAFDKSDEVFMRVNLHSEKTALKSVLRDDTAYCINVDNGDLKITDLSILVAEVELEVVEK